MKILIQKVLNNFGYQIKKFPEVDHDLKRRLQIVNFYNIDTIFDIGASHGQYANSMRELGYSKKIISFEPLKSAFKYLETASLNDKNWIVNNYALGGEDIKSLINVASNSYSSSILNMLPAHLNSAPQSRYMAKEEIEIKKLDSVFNSFCSPTDCIMLKIDTQGYEKKVIEGATRSLKKIKIMQMEISIIPLYENEMIFLEMLNYLDNIGFKLFSLENGFSDPNTGQLLQVDGIFVSKSLTNSAN
jgi:FkbM family methyltransferase